MRSIRDVLKTFASDFINDLSYAATFIFKKDPTEDYDCRNKV